jgi:hypothetical protein
MYSANLVAWDFWLLGKSGRAKSKVLAFPTPHLGNGSTLGRVAVYFRNVVFNAWLYDWQSFNNLSIVALYTWSTVFVTWHNWLLLASPSPRNRLAPNCLRWCGGYVGFNAVLKTGSRVDKPVSEHLRTQRRSNPHTLFLRFWSSKSICSPPPLLPTWQILFFSIWQRNGENIECWVWWASVFGGGWIKILSLKSLIVVSLSLESKEVL